MSEAGADETAGRLAAARRPLEPPRMPPASLGVRLKTTPLVRRALPTRVVVSRAERRGRAIWKRAPDARSYARSAIETIVSGTSRAGDIETLAKMHVVEREVNRALFWQRWRPVEIGSDSLANLRAATSAGTGVLVSYCHLGPFFHSVALGSMLERTTYTVAGAWCFEQPSPTYWGRRLVRRLEGAREHGGRLVRATRAFPVLKALLEEREVVLMHFDVPGQHETVFLGKQVMLTDGAARLAFASGAMIAPICLRRAGHQVWVDAGTPLHADAFAGVDELHEALAAVHERWILDMPHALEDPRRPGSWESGATPTGWTMPSVAQSAGGAGRDHTEAPRRSRTRMSSGPIERSPNSRPG